MLVDCEHLTLEFSPEATHVFDETPPYTYVAISVRCSDCRSQFHWRGVSSGRSNAAEPVVTADGYVLFAPIAPGPGAVVGLLSATGLTDRLINPAVSTNGGTA